MLQHLQRGYCHSGSSSRSAQSTSIEATSPQSRAHAQPSRTKLASAVPLQRQLPIKAELTLPTLTKLACGGEVPCKTAAPPTRLLPLKAELTLHPRSLHSRALQQCLYRGYCHSGPSSRSAHKLATLACNSAVPQTRLLPLKAELTLSPHARYTRVQFYSVSDEATATQG